MSTEQFVSLRSVSAIAAFLARFGGAALCSAQEVRASELPLVWVLSTGGTIAGKGASATDLSNYRSGSLLGQEIVSSVPEVKQIANVKVMNGR